MTHRWRRTLSFGPGLVFALAAFGPQDLASNTIAGATYGYRLLWTLLLIVLTRFIVLEATARYVIVTGETLMSGYARAGRWVVWLILASLFVKRLLAGMPLVLLLGSSSTLLLPLPTRWSAAIWATAWCASGLALMHWGKYRMVEKISKPLMALLGGSLLLAAVLSRPDLKAAAAGLFVPSVPAGQDLSSYSLVLLALIGSGAASLGNLKYSAFVHEKGWTDPTFLRRQRIDLLLGGLGIFSMYFLAQLAAAATLQPSAGHLRDVEDLVPMFAGVLGSHGRVVVALGIWAASFSTFLGATTGDSLMVVDLWRNALRGAPAPGAGGLSGLPEYRWCLAWFCVSPMFVLFTDWSPLWLAMLAAAVTALLLPVVVGILLWLTGSRKRMGSHANPWVVNGLMVLVIAASLYLAFLSGRKMLGL